MATDIVRTFLAVVWDGREGTVSLQGSLCVNGSATILYERGDGKAGAVLHVKRDGKRKDLPPGKPFVVYDGEDIEFGDDFARRVDLQHADLVVIWV